MAGPSPGGKREIEIEIERVTCVIDFFSKLQLLG